MFTPFRIDISWILSISSTGKSSGFCPYALAVHPVSGCSLPCFFRLFNAGRSSPGGREEFDKFLVNQAMLCSSLRIWAAKDRSFSMTVSLPES